MKNKVILTFDLEFWQDDDLINDYLPKNKEAMPDNILESTLPLLELLKKYGIKSTFFILGEVAEKYPDLIRKIQEAGHEIACHGYSHRRLDHLSKDEFENKIRLSVDLLRQVSGRSPIGFRAPYFSLNSKTKWALEIIEKYGFVYDSSIFPFETFWYGSHGIPLEIYKISKKDISMIDNDSKITELPLSVYEKGKIKIPVAGGFYFRAVPLFIYKRLLKLILKKRPAIIYIHPCELYNFVPRVKIPFWRKQIKFWGVGKSFKKLERLLGSKDLEFTSAENFLLGK